MRRQRCNTPRKLRFSTLKGAIFHAEALREPSRYRVADNPLEPYLCRSGQHYHLKSVAADGVKEGHACE